MRLLINILGYYGSWFSLLNYANTEKVVIGYVLSAIYISQHFIYSNTRIRDLKLLITLVILGSSLDATLAHFGYFIFSSPTTFIGIPFWLIVIWALFSLLPNHSLSWLRKFPIMTALAGFIGGPFAYYTGHILNAVQFSPVSNTLIWISIIWAILLPLILFKEQLMVKPLTSLSIYFGKKGELT